MKRLVLLVIALACGPHEEIIPLIHVNPDAAKRSMMLHGGVELGQPPKTPARVHLMKAGEELGGPNAIGRPGDFLLENEEVVFVIDQLGQNQGVGFAESGGEIVDAADAHVRKDELGQLFTYFGAFPRQGVYTSMSSGVLQDGTAFVEARGRELYEAGLVVRTRYTLHPNDRAVLIDTAIENTSDHVIALAGLGDAVQWGAVEKFAPDRGRAFKGPSSGSFVAGIGRYASYAITSTDGAIEAESGSSWTDTMQAHRTEIAAGKSVHYARVFVVGPRADISGLVAELTKTAGGPVGSVRVALMGDGHLLANLPVDATVAIADTQGHALMDLHADRNGALLGEIPPGKYQLRYLRGGGRGPHGVPQSIEVLANQESPVTVEVTAPGRVHAQCKERPQGQKDDVNVPCKATFEGVGIDAPSFGPGTVAGPAKNQVTTADGSIDVPLSPGKYRVTLSRGPEYALQTLEIDVKPNETVDACEPHGKCLLKRVVDTTGWLACDFHQHTLLGVDAAVTTGDRVISNVVEGVEVAVASEHNVIADLEPLVREMGLASRLVEIAGDELTTDASRKPWGHANAFPLVIHPELPRGGALIVRDRSAKDLFAEIRKSDPNAVIQVNHPRSGSTGYFDLLGFDAKTGSSTDPSYDPRFDAIEVWNGRNVLGRAAVLGDVLALLGTSHPVTITGNTDTHGIVGHEAGYPRTYVKVARDDGLDAWSESRTLDIVRTLRETRQVVVTNGPFMRVTAGGVGIGGIAKAQGGKFSVVVVVESAPWVQITHLVVMRASGPTVAKDMTQRPNALGALTATARFDLTFDKDDAFVVVASGDKTLEPVLSGDAAEIKPYAIAGAIWVDVDGDGHALGR
jgi:hypothetical protein